MRGLDRILDLQEVDLSIDRLTTRREALERGDDVETARRRADTLEDRLGELRLALDAVAREQARLEGETTSMESRIVAEERRLYDGSVANPKELEAIQAEVKNIRSRKSRTEDALLEQMERREGMESRLPQLEAEVAEARDRLAETEASTETELGDLERTLGERRAERATLVREIDEELVELYEDLRAQKRGVGAAALEDGVCQGCHQKLSPLELDRLKRTEGVRRCEYCRRILVPK